MIGYDDGLIPDGGLWFRPEYSVFIYSLSSKRNTKLNKICKWCNLYKYTCTSICTSICTITCKIQIR